jgi:phage terminase large subunit
MWFSWNPRFPTDPVDFMFRGGTPPPRTILLEVNFDQNPWLTPESREEMEYDRTHRPEVFQHIWMGGYVQNSEAQVFHNWRVEEFEAPKDAIFRFGADWGFSQDPTVLVRCYIEGRTIYVDHEAYKVGCEIMDTPSLFHTIPQSERWPMTADSSRPETISFMRTHGFPKIQPAVKGSGSIEEGVEWLKSYEIVIHPRCKHLIDEMVYYSYKIDPMTDKVLPILEDKHNHVIDALRYGCESARRNSKVEKSHSKAKPVPILSRWRK